MGYVSKLKMVLFSPSKFFDSVKTEEGMGSAAKFAVITGLIIGAIMAVMALVLTAVFAPLLAAVPGFGLLSVLGPIVAVLMLVLMPINLLIGPLVSAAIFHVFAKLLKGAGSFEDTYKAVAYSTAPAIIIAIAAFALFSVAGILAAALLLPVGGLAVMIWYIIILTIGISKMHVISKARAVLVWLIPIIIMFALAALLGLLAFLSLGSQLAAYQNQNAIGDTGLGGFGAENAQKIFVGECEQNPDTGGWCYTVKDQFGGGESCTSGKYECFSLRAQETGNAEECNIIPDEAIKSECLSAIFGG